jgi:hypothetical protein
MTNKVMPLQNLKYKYVKEIVIDTNPGTVKIF